jgi:hypothetical protein
MGCRGDDAGAGGDAEDGGLRVVCGDAGLSAPIDVGVISYDVWGGYPPVFNGGPAYDPSILPGGEFDFKAPVTTTDERTFSFDFGSGTETGIDAAMRYRIEELRGAVDYIAFGWYPDVYGANSPELRLIAAVLDAYLAQPMPKPRFALILQGLDVEENETSIAIHKELRDLLVRPEYYVTDQGRPILFVLAPGGTATSDAASAALAAGIAFASDTVAGGASCSSGSALRAAVPCLPAESQIGRPLGVDMDESEELRQKHGLEALTAYGTVRVDSGDYGHQSAWKTLEVDLDRAHRNPSTPHIHSLSPMNDHRPRHPESTFASWAGPQFRYWYDELTFGQWAAHVADMARRIGCGDPDPNAISLSLDLGAPGAARHSILVYSENEIDEGGTFRKLLRDDPHDPLSRDRYLEVLRRLRSGDSLAQHTNTHNDDRYDLVYQGTWRYFGPAAVAAGQSRPMGPHGRLVEDYRPGHYGNDESVTEEAGASVTFYADPYAMRIDVLAAHASGRGRLLVECSYEAPVGTAAVTPAPPAPVDLGASDDAPGSLPGVVASCEFPESSAGALRRITLSKADADAARVGFDRFVEHVDWSLAP